MQAIVTEAKPDLPNFYTWYLAKPSKGSYVKYGFVRYSEIDGTSWEVKQLDPHVRFLNPVQVVDAACARLEAQRELATTLRYDDVKRAWDAQAIKNSKVRAETALWLSRIALSELEGRDMVGDFMPSVAEAAGELRKLG
jgi:hypothetical protein